MAQPNRHHRRHLWSCPSLVRLLLENCKVKVPPRPHPPFQTKTGRRDGNWICTNTGETLPNLSSWRNRGGKNSTLLKNQQNEITKLCPGRACSTAAPCNCTFFLRECVVWASADNFSKLYFVTKWAARWFKWTSKKKKELVQNTNERATWRCCVCPWLATWQQLHPSALCFG